jgi:DNA-binding response OmpR family regulator
VTKTKRKRILLVDDEPDLNTLFHMALERAGFEVQTHENPLLALSHFKPGFFDLIILDIKMPEMDGFELFKELRKKDSKANICFLTASEMYYEENRKREYDSMDKVLFIRKPISNNELVEKLKYDDSRLQIIIKLKATIRGYFRSYQKQKEAFIGLSVRTTHYTSASIVFSISGILILKEEACRNITLTNILSLSWYIASVI